MGKINTTQYAVLGVLTLGESSGYEVRKHFETAVSHFWSESYGQIYPALKKLTEEGYAEEVEGGERSRGQKRYRITDEGERRFRDWLGGPIDPVSYRDELLLRTFFARKKDIPAVRFLFERELAGMQQAREAYLKQQTALVQHEGGEEHPFLALTLRYGELFVEARYAWCTEALALLDRLEGENES
ncbi:PadR family transcriptional regulator [Saccharibacillus sacchari]|uniref:PadR family transcriptional regulator n=1 Tax=Saccharibacillus sacchari TaxID=456493 RepID=A0ACC6P8R1_9BACL